MTFDDPVEVTIWFTADQARFIRERQWAKEQKVTERKDGSIVLAMETSGWYDVKKWMLSFGADAVMLEPVAMREQIRNELENSLKRYVVAESGA